MLLLDALHPGLSARAAQVRAVGSQQSPFIEDLKRAEEAAQQQAVGVWNKVTSLTCRPLSCAPSCDPLSLVLQDPVALTNAVRDAKYEDGTDARLANIPQDAC
jgi:hypothetical protein